MDDEQRGKRYNLRNGSKANPSTHEKNQDVPSAEKPSTDDSRGKSTATKPKPKSKVTNPKSSSTSTNAKPASKATKGPKGASARKESIDRSDEDRKSPPPNDHRRVNRARPQGAGVLGSPSSKVRDLVAHLLADKETNAMKLQDVLDQAHTLTDKIDLLIELRKLDEDGLAELTFSSLQIDGGITFRRDRDETIERCRGAGVLSANDAESPVSNGGDFDVSMRSAASPIMAEGFDYDFDDDLEIIPPTPPIPPQDVQQAVPDEVDEGFDRNEPIANREEDTKRNRCYFCGKLFSDNAARLNHEREKHGIGLVLKKTDFKKFCVSEAKDTLNSLGYMILTVDSKDKFIKDGIEYQLFVLSGDGQDLRGMRTAILETNERFSKTHEPITILTTKTPENEEDLPPLQFSRERTPVALRNWLGIPIKVKEKKQK